MNPVKEFRRFRISRAELLQEKALKFRTMVIIITKISVMIPKNGRIDYRKVSKIINFIFSSDLIILKIQSILKFALESAERISLLIMICKNKKEYGA